MNKLNEKFFERDSEEVAKELLGKKLVRLNNGKLLEGIISETGAFLGESRDKQNGDGMYNAAGKIYMMPYRGLNFLNVGTDSRGIPSVVHISGLLLPDKTIYGPGKLTKELLIDSKFDNRSINGQELWIEDMGLSCGYSIKRQGLAKNCIAYYQMKTE